jgi:hypothetical protein
MMKKIFMTLFIACYFYPLTASANDGFAAVGVGGVTIAKTDTIAIKNELLEIACDKINVTYDFVNESYHDEDATIMFPLPAYPANIPESDSFAIGQPADFTITVDGQPVEYQTQVKAILVKDKWINDKRIIIKEIDVTEKLKAAGLSEKDIVFFRFKSKYVRGKKGENGHFSFPISKASINKLTKLGLMADGNMGETTPQWENRVTYIWTQRFPANKTVHVEHSYRPFSSGGAEAGFTEYRNMKEFCLSKQNVSKLKALSKSKKNLDNYNSIPGTNVRYILTTANSWKDGIRDFTLRIYPKSKNEVVSACIPAKLEQTSDKVYEAKIINFKPKEELSVYFGNARSCNGSNTGVPPKFESAK